MSQDTEGIVAPYTDAKFRLSTTEVRDALGEAASMFGYTRLVFIMISTQLEPSVVVFSYLFEGESV